MNQNDRPTIPVPPISSKELAEEWEKRLKETERKNGEER